MTYMDHQYIAQVNRTYSKSFSKRQMLPKIIIKKGLPTSLSVLDYGAGKDLYGTELLRTYFDNVTAYDIGCNYIEGLHTLKALYFKYDIIMMSNIINSQPDEDSVINVLKEGWMALKKGGCIFCNLPLTPRKNTVNEKTLHELMGSMFGNVSIDYKNNVFKSTMLR